MSRAQVRRRTWQRAGWFAHLQGRKNEVYSCQVFTQGAETRFMFDESLRPAGYTHSPAPFLGSRGSQAAGHKYTCPWCGQRTGHGWASPPYHEVHDRLHPADSRPFGYRFEAGTFLAVPDAPLLGIWVEGRLVAPERVWLLHHWTDHLQVVRVTFASPARPNVTVASVAELVPEWRALTGAKAHERCLSDGPGGPALAVLQEAIRRAVELPAGPHP